MKDVLYLDFETKAIGKRPQDYPPKPVGYAWMLNGKKAYESWGHPEGNNTTFDVAHDKLLRLLKDAKAVAMHNSLFDREVCEVGMKIKITQPIHDTMTLAFLNDPYGPLSLKPLAHRDLGEPPEEQDLLHDWIVANVKGATRKTAGAYISEAPVKLVKPYAIGDVTRTKGLFEKYNTLVCSEAYMREMALQPVVLDMEKQGVRIDPRLVEDMEWAYKTLETCDYHLSKILGKIDMDTDADVARALEHKKKLSSPLPVTADGNTQVNKHALTACVKDPNLLGLLLLRSALATCARTFMSGWITEARPNDWRMFFRFNPVRSEYGVGAKTGRMSSSPNMMNVPSTWEILRNTFKKIGYKPPFDLPNMRKYILPDFGHKMIGCDLSQIEMRLFAHYEDGELMRAYQKNPDSDAHQMVADIAGISRKVAKTLSFAELYGAGIAVVMSQLDCSEQEARQFKAAYRAALPGIKDLRKSIDAAADAGEGITTIGGRKYQVEPPKFVNGQRREFKYKLLNYLCQGGAADQMKQAMIDYYNHPKREGRIMFPVHDQKIVSAPAKAAVAEAKLVQECMTSAMQQDLDVPLRAAAVIGECYADV